jgi:hypothetical protein
MVVTILVDDEALPRANDASVREWCSKVEEAEDGEHASRLMRDETPHLASLTCVCPR